MAFFAFLPAAAEFIVVSGVDKSDLFASSRSKDFELIEGVLDPPSVEVSCAEVSLGAEGCSSGIEMTAFSRPVMASDIVRRPFLRSFTVLDVGGGIAMGVFSAEGESVGALPARGVSVPYESVVTLCDIMFVVGSLTIQVLGATSALF